MKRLFDLTGRVALVAGGGGYLGQPICEALASHGATVVVADLRASQSQRVADIITDQGGQAHWAELDISQESSILRVVEQVAADHRQLDMLVNTACLPTGKSWQQSTSADWAAALQVNLTGAFLLGRSASQVMVEQGGGSIIQFGSMYGQVSPDPRAYARESSVNPPDYGAAKAGISQLVRYQAVMLAPHRVRVNAVIPGPFPNPTVQSTDPAFIQRLADRCPMGRVGQAKEIAGAVVYLASDAASYVTGTSLVVDGGWTAW